MSAESMDGGGAVCGARGSVLLSTMPQSASAAAAPTPAASAATVEQGVQARAQVPSETEDGYYCRYVRGMSGAFYYKGLGSYTEWVPVGELHTGGNVKG